MKKAVTLLVLIGIAAFGLFYFSKDSGYDLSQSGDGAVKGSFVPEQHTDYIFTTTSETSGLYIGSIVAILTFLFLFRNNFKSAIK